MSNERVTGLHFVKAFPPNSQMGSEAQMWIAATSADKAVQAVLDKLGSGWRAELSADLPTKEQASKFKLRPGDVSEVSQAL